MIPNQTIRAFIAIPVPDGIRDFYIELQKKLKKEGFHASWPRPETLHLTLKFIGDIERNRVGKVTSCMDAAAFQVKNSIELSGSAIGVFPSVKNPRVIWAGIRGQTHVLGDLVSGLDQLLNQKAGIRREKKRFSPHLTLARVKSRVEPKKMIDIIQRFSACQSNWFAATGIRLFSSQLKSNGAVHTPIYTAEFSKRC